MRRLTEEQFFNLLSDKVEAAGSQKALARKLGVSEQYLSDVLKGRRRAGEKILSALKMRAITNYVEDKK